MEKYYKRIPNPTVLDEQKEHAVLMKAVVDSIGLFLRQGWAYEGIDHGFVNDIWGIFREETVDEYGMLSSDRRMFVEVLELLANVNKPVNNALTKDVSKYNQKLTSQAVQREIVRICAKETISSILSEIGDSKFSLILDGWVGVNWQEHFSLVVRFVDKTGALIERFLGTIHVPEEDRTALSLKKAIEEYLREAGIQLEKLRYHSYNGSSMLWEILSDLRGIFLEENKSAYYIHCMSHQFELTVVAVGQFNSEIYTLFKFIDGLRDLFKDMPIKVKDPLKEEELAEILKSVNAVNAVFTSEKLLYYNAIVCLIANYYSVLDLVEFTYRCGLRYENKNLHQAHKSEYTFEFVFCLHLMRDIVSLTNEISQLLQMRENEIEKAVSLVGVVNQKLGYLRDHGRELLLSQVSAFCEKNEIEVPDMAAIHPDGPCRKEKRKITNFQYYHDELFLSIVEMEIQEINKQFTEIITSLILCIAAMNPKNSFSSFNKEKMMHFAQFFPCDFSPEEIGMLDNELEKYIIDMRSSPDFKDLDGIAKLAKKLVLTQRVEVYPLVYRVIELALIIPISAPTIERVVSSGKVVKKWVSARPGNEWLNDCLVTYIEQDIFRNIENEVIIKRFESFKSSLEQN